MDIQISHLAKDYGKFRALDDVTLSIGSGMFGLLGPNGAGKSTLMRILATLLPLTSGTVTLGGCDVMRQPAEVRQRLGYLPQEFGFFRGLNAYEMLDYIGTMKNIPRAERKRQVEALLEDVNLTRDAHRRIGGFSGGMKQRLGIAQALLGNPDLLIVDEPTAGLDPEERIRFRNLLTRIAGQRTVLLSTHIVADIEASCVGVAVLDRGRLIFNGTPDALIAQACDKVWQFECSAAEWERIEQQYRVISSRAAGRAYEVRVIADERPTPQSVSADPTFEDGYMAVFGASHHANQAVAHA